MIDIYSRVTQKIIHDLEKENLTWRKPWSSENLAGLSMRPLRHNEIPYSGINTIILWATAVEKGYGFPYWMTFKQASDMKAHIRKGETAEYVVYADKFAAEETKDDGSTETKMIPFLKTYAVFNVQQIDGLPPKYYQLPEIKNINADNRIKHVEDFFAATNARMRVGTNAAYHPTADCIEMPPFESFHDAIGYYATLSHETAHWTKHESRLSRDFGKKRKGDTGYAKEELVAELAACFLGAELGFEPIIKETHAAYIQSWLMVLKYDKRFIFEAASHAQRAVDYLKNLQPSNHEACHEISLNKQVGKFQKCGM